MTPRGPTLCIAFWFCVGATAKVITTPPPCDGTDHCPYYWHQAADRYYQVYIDDTPSFVYQSEIPNSCDNGCHEKGWNQGCAHGWNVKSQSFTSAAVDFSKDGGVQIKVLSRMPDGSGKLSTKAFNKPEVKARFGMGSPKMVLENFGQYIFNVSAPGHYSVELFGQDDLQDALFIFINDISEEESCPQPSNGGRQIHYTGPNIVNKENPSWKNTGYYGFDSIKLNAHDVVCIDRGAVVQGHIFAADGCKSDYSRIQGFGIISGTPWKTPCDDHDAQVQMCGKGVSMKDVTVINGLASNVELNPYWLCGTDCQVGAVVDNVKILSTWWYSTDGVYVGPSGIVKNSFLMVNDDALKPMVSNVTIENNTVWQGNNGWSIMFEWNWIGHQSGMSVRNVHIIHVGHTADAYCYPCTQMDPKCWGGEEKNGYCDGKPEGYQGYRAVIGAIYGAAGVISDATVDNVLVSGPYVRAISIATTWSLFGNNPRGSLNNWVFGGKKSVTFEMPQKKGIKSKIWSTGPGFSRMGGSDIGTVYNMAFPQLYIDDTQVVGTNWGDFFAIADQCSPDSVWGGWGGNVGTITFGNASLSASASASTIMHV